MSNLSSSGTTPAGDVPPASASDTAERAPTNRSKAAASDDGKGPNDLASESQTTAPSGVPGINIQDFIPRPDVAAVKGPPSVLPAPYSPRNTTTASYSSSARPTLDEVFQRLEIDFARLSRQQQQLCTEREEQLRRSEGIRINLNRLRYENDRVDRAADIANAKYEAAERVKAENTAEKARLAKKSKELDKREKALRSMAISSNINNGPLRVAHALTLEDDSLPGLHSSSSSLTNRDTAPLDAAEIPDILRHRPSVRRARSQNFSPSISSFRIVKNDGRSASCSGAPSSGVMSNRQDTESISSGVGERNDGAEAEEKVALPPGKGIRRVSKSNDLRG